MVGPLLALAAGSTARLPDERCRQRLAAGPRDGLSAGHFSPGREADSRVAWLGHVDQPTIERLYNESDCAIFPAQAVPLQQAKCSVRLATTLLNGVPVVASAVGEQTAYGANGAADLIDADATPEAFADAVHALLCDRCSAGSDGPNRRCQHLTQQYAWSRLGQDLVEFYGQFANKHL